MSIKVSAKFKPLYLHAEMRKLFYVFHGGRGGGKSWEIADFLLIIGTTDKHRILCCREVQKSIKQTVGVSISACCQSSRVCPASHSFACCLVSQVLVLTCPCIIRFARHLPLGII